MAQQAGASLLAIGGEVIGAFLGGPIGAAIGGLAGGLIGSLVFNRASKPYVPDINLMQSSYGNPIPIFYGSVRMPATVVWMDQIQVSQHGLGKGLGLAGQNAYSYHQDAMLMFGEGPGRMVKLFLDGKLWIDNTAGGQQQSTYTFAIREYDGSEDQTADWLYSNWVAGNVDPPGAAPGYRGMCLLVFQGIDLAHFGTRFPQVTAVWTTESEYTTTFAGFVPWANSISDANGAGYCVDWIRQILYTLQDDGTVRSYDLNSQQQLAEARPLDSVTGASNAPFVPSPPGVAIITCGNGTGLYGVSGAVYVDNRSLTAYGLVFFTLDPGSLQPTGFFLAERSGAELPSVNVQQLICDNIGGTDCLAGVLVIGNVIFCCPSANSFGEIEYPGAGLAGEATIIWQSPGSGNVTVASWNNLDGSGTLYLSNTNFNTPNQVIAYEAGGGGEAAEGFIEQLTPSMTMVPSDVGDTANGGAGASIVYDGTDGTVIIAGIAWNGPVRSFKVDVGSNSIIWTSTTWEGGGFVNAVLDNGILSWASGVPNIPVVSTSTTAITDSPNPTTIGPAIGGTVSYNSYLNAAVFPSESNGYQIAYLMQINASEVPVADIITDICGRVGLLDSDIDVSAVTNTVWGYAITSQKSAGACLADLCHVFQLDMVESDYTLKFVPRGQAPVLTLTQDDLGSTDDKDAGRFWQAKMAQQQELPLQINVKYQDPNLDYNPGAEYAKRNALPVPTVFSKRKKAIDLPIVATALEARQIAETWLYTMWAERNTYDTVLSMEYLWLDPGDNVVVNMDNGDSYGVRTQSVQTGADLTMQINFCSEQGATYVASTSPGVTYGQQPQTVQQSPFGLGLLFNVPLLQDTDDTGGTTTRCYFAAGSLAAASAWSSGAMYNSTDGGATWTVIQTLPVAAPWGHATNALPSVVSAFAMDRWNSVRIAFIGSYIPTGCSYADIMNGANPLLLGSELIQFMNVTENGDGSVTLSGLARGRRGTEWAIGSHKAGDVAILLSATNITSAKKALTEIGQPEQWVLVPSGRYIDQVPRQSFTYLGYDLYPYAPVNFARAPSGSNLVLTWIRRTRFGGWMIDGIDTAPLNEASEAYDAYILPDAAALASFDPTNSATYTRAFTGLTSATVTYTAADMTADGFNPATQTLYLVVYQISAAVGRGFQGYQALPAF